MMEGTGTLESQLEATKVSVKSNQEGFELMLQKSYQRVCVGVTKTCKSILFFFAAQVSRGACPEDPVETYRRPWCSYGREAYFG